MEENILVSNIIYISLLVLCLVLIIILFKQLRTTNKLLKTTQDKFHTKLSALENKYATSRNVKPIIPNEIEEPLITRHEEIVNNLPLYAQKLFTTTSTIIFTAMMLYTFYFISIVFNQATYSVLNIPYLEGSNKVNLWSFYVSNFMMLLIAITSLCIFVIFYITGWLGALTPSIISLKKRLFYNTLIAIVMCSTFILYLRNYEWWVYLISIIILVLWMSIIQYRDNKKQLLNKPIIQNNKSDKLLRFIAASLATVYIAFYLFAAIISVNGFSANYFGKKKGEILLTTILDDKYLESHNHIILKATQENIYLLDCEGSECTGLRKINDDKVTLAFFERKDFTFYSEPKEKTD